MKMSFGMIFSIILIIAFIAFAFFGIKKFLGLQDDIKVKQFAENLQNDVDTVWRSAQTTVNESYALPSYVESICLESSDDPNLVMLATDHRIIPVRNIDNLNLAAIIPSGSNQKCFEVNKGKLELVLKKGFRETLVTIEGK